MEESIWTRFSLIGCLLHWLEPYWNGWPWVKGQGHSDVISIFLHDSLLTSLLTISALLCPIKMKFSLSLRYALGRFVFEFDKIRMGDDVIVTSFTFSASNWAKKKASVINCRLLYCTLVPGMMSVSVIVCKIWPLVHFCDLWPSHVTFIIRQGHFHSYP